MSDYQNPETCDHLLEWKGMDDGYAGFDLLCVHPHDHFRTDDDGVEHEECIVQSWYDECGDELVQASATHPHRWTHGKLRLFSHWTFSNELTLYGAGEHANEMEIVDVSKSDTQHVWVEAE